jgi:hypothetical protein
MKHCSFGVISHRMFRHNIDETLLIWRYISSDVPAWYIYETLLIWRYISSNVPTWYIDETLLICRYISSDVPPWYRWNITHLALYLIECSDMIKMKHCSYGVISHRMFRHDIDETLLIWHYISSNVPSWYRWSIAHMALYLIECSGMI